MLEFRLILIGLIWFGLAIALLTGYFYSPNYRAARSDNPKAYWAGMGTSAIAGILATILLLRG
jgi:hypothetical protein